MSTSVSTAFVADYDAKVHQAFQRRGGVLLPTVRHKSRVVGSTETFQKIGTGTATTKSRHGTITPMNQSHTTAVATLADFYAGDWVDKLDESKITIDERMALANGGAWALGRKVDDQILTAMNADTTNDGTFTVTSKATVLASLLEMVEVMDDNDVPDDGQRYALLTPRAHSQAATVEEFASADYVDASGNPFKQGLSKAGRWKEWAGTKWGTHTGLPSKGGATAECYIYHKSAVGYASAAAAGNIAGNQSVSADITWHGDRAAHFINHMMSGGAVVIDGNGMAEYTIDDTAAIVTS